VSISMVDPLMLEGGWRFKQPGERLVGANAERLLFEHLSVPHENAALAHQPDCHA
jgi:hypothetical protein